MKKKTCIIVLSILPGPKHQCLSVRVYTLLSSPSIELLVYPATRAPSTPQLIVQHNHLNQVAPFHQPVQILAGSLCPWPLIGQECAFIPAKDSFQLPFYKDLGANPT